MAANKSVLEVILSLFSYLRSANARFPLYNWERQLNAPLYSSYKHQKGNKTLNRQQQGEIGGQPALLARNDCGELKGTLRGSQGDLKKIWRASGGDLEGRSGGDLESISSPSPVHLQFISRLS